MNINFSYWGLILLGVWMILVSLMGMSTQIAMATKFLPILILISGILILVDSLQSRCHNIGMLLLSIWLVLTGVQAYMHMGIPTLVMNLFMLATGVLLIARK